MEDTFVGRVMLALSLMIVLALPSMEALARPISVFDVRWNIPLSDEEPVYNDYYISGGSRDGLTVGQELVVERRVLLKDSLRSKPGGEFRVPVAKLKVLYVQTNISVARLMDVTDHSERPVVDHPTVLLGDLINVGAQAKGFKGAYAKKAKLEKVKAQEALEALEAERAMEAAVAAQASPSPQVQIEPVPFVEPEIVEPPTAEELAKIENDRLAKELSQIRETRADKDLVLSTEIMVKESTPVVIQ